jgi:predicted phage terminase large subunit-like protein
VAVAQRLHENDLAGHLLAQGGWEHVDLPAIAIEDQVIAMGQGKQKTRRIGDILHPARESRETLDRIKAAVGSQTFSAQYQQRPIPIEGNLVKRPWLQWYETMPSEGTIVQSWDCASTIAITAAYSACSTWRICGRQYYLLDIWRGRVEFPQLRRQVIALARKYRPDSILIEQAGVGLALIQELRINPVPEVPTPIGIKPVGDKVMRMMAQSPRFEAGQVHLPKQAPWLGELLNETLGFPNTRYCDQVDSISQCLEWVQQKNQLIWSFIGSAGKMWIAGREVRNGRFVDADD